MSYTVNNEPISGYRLVKFLGRGGFGEVWSATSPGGIQVALKIINLGRREGTKEFRALRLFKSIHHPNLTPITAFWLKDEDGYLVDEAQVGPDLGSRSAPDRIRGTVSSLSPARASELIIAMGLGDMSVSDRLEQCLQQGLPGIPPRELFEYMEASARAIDFLNSPRHDLGRGPISPIQHCDIKPQNILIVGGAAQVCDFGLARELGGDARVTTAAVSPAYGAPECIEGNPPSPTTDQYSLAISYVEMRTGALPFAEPDSYMKVINAHLHGGLDLSGLSPDEKLVIQRATARGPADRYESCLKMVRALERACPDTPDSVNIPAPPKRREVMGSEIIPGYKLVEQIYRGPCERIWSANGPGRNRIALVIQDLAPDETDHSALAVVQSLPPHKHIAGVNAFWLLDESYESLLDPPTLAAPKRPPTKLLIAADAINETLMQRATECFKRTGQAIPPEELLGYLDQVAEALDFLNAREHEHEGQPVAIVHCNLRPQNIWLERDQARLANFTLARLLGAQDAPRGVRVEPPFDPPEAREGRLTQRSDQYALAVTYAQLRRPGLTSGLRGSRRRAVSLSGGGSGLDLSGLNPLEVEAIERATAEDPLQRFDSCRRFIEQVRQAKPAPIVQTAPIAVTAPLPGHEESYEESHERPVQRSRTKETITSAGRDTKVDRAKVTAVFGAPAGPSMFRKIVLTAVTVLVLAGIGFGGKKLWDGRTTGAPKDPQSVSEESAIILAQIKDEKDPDTKLKRARGVIEECTPFAYDKYCQAKIDEAQKICQEILTNYSKKVIADWNKLKLEPLDALGIAKVKSFMDECQRLESLFPAAQFPEAREIVELHVFAGQRYDGIEANARIDELFKAANVQWAARSLSELAETVDKALKDEPLGPKAEQFREFRRLATLANKASSAEEVKSALDEFRNAVDNGTVDRWVDYSKCLQELSIERPQTYLEQAIEQVRLARESVNRDDKQQITEILKDLDEQNVASLIDNAGDRDAKQYFQDLKTRCDEALKDQSSTEDLATPLVKVALREWEVEDLGTKQPPTNRKKELKKFLDSPLQTPADHQLYEKYVRLLAVRKMGEGNVTSPDAGALSPDSEVLKELASHASDGLGVNVPFRQQRLADVLIEEAAKLRSPNNDARPKVELVFHSYGVKEEQKRKLAYEWLAAAERMRGAATSDDNQTRLLTELALASSDKKEVEIILGKLDVTANKTWDRLALQLVKSRSQPIEAGLGGWADVVKELLSVDANISDEDVVFVYNKLIAPKIKLGESHDKRDVLKKQLAKLYWCKGKAFESNKGKPFPVEVDQSQLPKDRNNDIVKAFNTAVEYDPGDPMYRVAHGLALLSLNKSNPICLKEAEEAIRLDPNLSIAHEFMAQVWLAQAESEKSLAERPRLYENAVNAGEKARDLAGADPLAKKFCLLRLANTYVQWANFSYLQLANSGDPTKETSLVKLLNKAVSCAKAALDIPGDAYSDFAYINLGNAYEDLAWLMKVDQDQNYDRAIEAFGEAMRIPASKEAPYFHRGRCFAKRELESGQTGRGFANDAKTDLEEAIRLNDQLAEAHYWLGRVHFYQQSYVDAEREYGKARELADKPGATSNVVGVYAWEWANSYAMIGEVSQTAVQERVDDLLRNYMEPGAIRYKLLVLKGRSLEREKRWEDAIGHYNRSLNANGKPTVEQIDLLRARRNCIAAIIQIRPIRKMKEKTIEWTKEKYVAIATDGVADAKQIIDLQIIKLQLEPPWEDYCEQAVALYTLARTLPQDKQEERAKLLEQAGKVAAGATEKALKKAAIKWPDPDGQFRQLLEANASLATAGAAVEKANDAIERAARLAPNADKAGEVRRLKQSR